MYGIFTDIWVILFGQMLVNIPAPWFAYGCFSIESLTNRMGVFPYPYGWIFSRIIPFHSSHSPRFSLFFGYSPGVFGPGWPGNQRSWDSLWAAWLPDLDRWGFPKSWGYPLASSIYRCFFHCKPSIWGYPHVRKPSHIIYIYIHTYK